MADALLKLQDVRVQYGDSTVLDIPDLTVESGELLAIIGPNGAGKSTLLRIMGLLEQPKRGIVRFQGKEVDRNNLLPLRRRMGSVFQQALLLNASVYENAALGLKLRGLDRRSTEQRVLPWLERLGIAHLAQRPARSLSGGEAQRTSLARALSLDPELLLLDEAFSALDHPTREELLLDLETLLRQTGITTVFVTHDRNEAFAFGDRVGILIGGRLLQVGVTGEVFAHPATEEVAQFVGIENRISAIVETGHDGRTRLRFTGGRALVAGYFEPGENVLLCLRPENITLRPQCGGDSKPNAYNRLEGRVAKIIPRGSHYRLDLDCAGNRLVVFVSRSSIAELGLQAGQNVVASFKDTDVHIIKPAPSRS